MDVPNFFTEIELVKYFYIVLKALGLHYGNKKFERSFIFSNVSV